MKTLENPREIKLFHIAFQLNRMVVFNVNYYKCGGNTQPHFTTSADKFNQPKTDYSECGQAQERLCFGKAKVFFKKWDKHHLLKLNAKQYREMVADLEVLKAQYNYIEQAEDIRFSQARELSKLKLKNA